MDLELVYRNHCADQGFDIDLDQHHVMSQLQSFIENRSTRTAKGLYLWGGVGRGKTMLMDLMFGSLSVAEKRRIHFHELMRWVRDRLSQITQTANPMKIVAAELAPPGSIICIDEFHVSDVDNALTLEILLKELLSSRTVIVTTSNFSPDQVIDRRLGEVFRRNNRDSPIDGPGLFETSKHATEQMLKANFQIIEMPGAKDYRTVSDSHHLALDARHPETVAQLRALFAEHGGELDAKVETHQVFGREVTVMYAGNKALWLEYEAICEAPYSYRDYLEFFSDIDFILLSDVHICSIDGAKRFGWLIEVIYDANKAFAMSVVGGFESLFKHVVVPPELALEIQRIESRVSELTR